MNCPWKSRIGLVLCLGLASCGGGQPQSSSGGGVVNGPPGSISDSFYGIHINSLSDPWPFVPNSAWRSLSSAINWNQINTAPGVYDWSRFDEWMSAAQNHNTDILYTIYATPTWASSGGINSGNPDQLCTVILNSGPGICDPPVDLNSDGTGPNTIFQDFMKALMAHVGPGKIKYFEIWNEPNIRAEWNGTNAQLARLAQDASTIVKTADPNAQISGPPAVAETANYFDTLLSTTNIGQSLDVVGFHGYPSATGMPEDLIPMIQNYQAAMASHGLQSKPLFDTEGSWGQRQICTGSCQQYFTARWYLIQMSMGVSRVYWFAWDFTDTGDFYDPANGQLTLAGSTEKIIHGWAAGSLFGALSQSGSVYQIPLTTATGVSELAVWDVGGNSTFSVPSKFQGFKYFNADGTSGTAGGTITIGVAPILLTASQ
jgi:polysaccharide biosynthesis protein PslG